MAASRPSNKKGNSPPYGEADPDEGIMAVLLTLDGGAESKEGGKFFMDQKKKEGQLLAKAALIFSIAKDGVIILIEILKLLLKK